MKRFEDKTILITGGTSGIGLATAQRLLQEGARVAVTGTSEARLALGRGVLCDRRRIRGRRWHDRALNS